MYSKEQREAIRTLFSKIDAGEGHSLFEEEISDLPPDIRLEVRKYVTFAKKTKFMGEELYNWASDIIDKISWEEDD